MLRYSGSGSAFTRDGNSCVEENYIVEAAVTSASDEFIQFSEQKHFRHGLTIAGEFRVDLQSVHVQFPDKNLDLVYFRRGESAGSIAIQGENFSISSSANLSKIRNVLIGANRIWVEELHPSIDDMSDLSEQEKAVLRFITFKATSFLNVSALILIGSRAVRTQSVQSDFDIVIDGRGGPVAWKLLGDSIRNEAPTLASIDIIDAESVKSQSFFNSIYSQGRFFYGSV